MLAGCGHFRRELSDDNQYGAPGRIGNGNAKRDSGNKDSYRPRAACPVFRGGSPARARERLNVETIWEMQLAFKRGGRKAIDKVMKDQRAIFLKLLVLLVPREMRVEHTGGVKAMTDEQLEAGIEAITAMLEQRAGSVPGVPRWSPVGPAGFIKFLLRYWPNLVRRSKIPVMVREPTPPPAHLTLGAKGPQHGDVLCGSLDQFFLYRFRLA